MKNTLILAFFSLSLFTIADIDKDKSVPQKQNNAIIKGLHLDADDPAFNAAGKIEFDMPKGSTVETFKANVEEKSISFSSKEQLIPTDLITGVYAFSPENYDKALTHLTIQHKRGPYKQFSIREIENKKIKQEIALQATTIKTDNFYAIQIPNLEWETEQDAFVIVGKAKNLIKIYVIAVEKSHKKAYIVHMSFEWGNKKPKFITKAQYFLKAIDIDKKKETVEVDLSSKALSMTPTLLQEAQKETLLRMNYKQASEACDSMHKTEKLGNTFSLASSEIVEKYQALPNIKKFFNQKEDPDRCIWTNTPVPNQPNQRYIWSYKTNSIAWADEEFEGCQPFCFYTQR
jgi:hypothetical protein